MAKATLEKEKLLRELRNQIAIIRLAQHMATHQKVIFLLHPSLSGAGMRLS